MRKAVYAGSFDPITNGHLWMIREAAPLFDELVISIGVNPEKRSTFSLEQRLVLLRDATAGIQNITIASFENLFLVDYAKSVGANYILRGIRNESDFTYERAMRHVNSDLSDSVLTVFLMPPRDIAEVSSSLVKGMIGPEGWETLVQQYVPEGVFEALRLHHEASRA